MSITVLSGIIIVRGIQKGSATLNFSSHKLNITKPGFLAKARHVGKLGTFVKPPCFHLSLREFNFVETPDGEGVLGAFPSMNETFMFEIHDRCTEHELFFEWNAHSDQPKHAMIEEISYMIIGETG